MTYANEEKSFQDDCCQEGEYIIHLTEWRINNVEMNLATTYNCSRHFNSTRELLIYKVCWCKQCNQIEECKLNDGMTNPDYIQSVQDPIAYRLHPSEIPSQQRIQWPKCKQRAT